MQLTMMTSIGIIQRERNTMENKIITPIMDSQPTGPSPDMLAKLKEWNETCKGGEWLYSNEFGLVWKSACADLMGGAPTPPNPSTPPSLLGELVRWGNTLDLDSVKPNAVLTIKLSSQNVVHAQQMQKAIISMVLAPRAEKLKDKRLTVLFMAHNDDISLIEESEMEEAGWQKKDPTLIVSPFKR
jgi:hypothetical protein